MVRATRPAPRALSPAALNCYRICPRRYGLTYMTDLPAAAPGLPALLGGTVHGVLADLFSARAKERTSVAELLDRRVRREELSPVDREVLHLRATVQLDRFSEQHDLTVEPVAVERWVDAGPHLGRPRGGRIDRADLLADGTLEIWDYKTGARPSDFEAGDEVAARIYALGAACRWPHRPVRVRYAWLDEGRDDLWAPEDEDLEAARRSLDALTERICSDRSMVPVPGPACDRCPLRRWCPAGPIAAGTDAAPTTSTR